MALSEPDDFKKDKKHSPTAKSKKRHGDPDLSQATFLLSAPIEVDLRENVAAALEESGSAESTRARRSSSWCAGIRASRRTGRGGHFASSSG